MVRLVNWESKKPIPIPNTTVPGMISIIWVFKLNTPPIINVPAAEIKNPIIKMFLDPNFDVNFAPSNEKSKMVIDAGNSARPVVNASALVTCCRNTGIIKRNPAKGICDMMEFMLPNPNKRFLRRDISDKGYAISDPTSSKNATLNNCFNDSYITQGRHNQRQD